MTIHTDRLLHMLTYVPSVRQGFQNLMIKCNFVRVSNLTGESSLPRFYVNVQDFQNLRIKVQYFGSIKFDGSVQPPSLLLERSGFSKFDD